MVVVIDDLIKKHTNTISKQNQIMLGFVWQLHRELKRAREQFKSLLDYQEMKQKEELDRVLCRIKRKSCDRLPTRDYLAIEEFWYILSKVSGPSYKDIRFFVAFVLFDITGLRSSNLSLVTVKYAYDLLDSGRTVIPLVIGEKRPPASSYCSNSSQPQLVDALSKQVSHIV